MRRLHLLKLCGIVVMAVSLRASAQLPSAVRRDAVEWADSAGVATRAIVWAPMNAAPTVATLLFSPGFGQAPEAYSKLLSAWASRGFIVVGIAHPRWSDSANIELLDVSGVVARQLTSALDHIVHDASRPKSVFARVDPARIGVVGHSIGGSAAAQASALEGQFKAAMNLDGTVFGPVVHTGIQQPLFLLRKRVAAPSAKDPPKWFENRDQADLHEDSLWAHTPTMYWLTVDGLDHMAFTDAGLDETLAEEAKSAFSFRLSARRTHEMTTHYVVDFFNFYLNRATKPLILDRSPFAGTKLRVRK